MFIEVVVGAVDIVVVVVKTLNPRGLILLLLYKLIYVVGLLMMLL